MTSAQFARFSEIRDHMRRYIDSMLEESDWILEIQRRLYRARGYREEELESPIVYNLALDEVTEMSEPHFIIVADNPGLQEQKTKNHRYLIGQSGKLAVSWFRANLGMDFRSSTIIINKTPIHTPKTAELRLLTKLAGERREELLTLLDQSQRAMARFAVEFAECLGCALWISGIGELRSRGIFRVWAEELRARALHSSPEVRANILLFRHFSMNQFAIEYAASRKAQLTSGTDGSIADEPAADAPAALLQEIGARNRKKILGF